MSVQVSCPGCGAPVEFTIGSSLVKVCQYCQSVVARGDRKIEDLGKVAALVETDSALEVGLTGTYRGQPFTLTGRAQLRHSAGGVWDEWYASFPKDRWGWIAEAQGRFYLTFAQKMPGNDRFPTFEQLGLGQAMPIAVGGTRLVVAEKGLATSAGAEGEIPYRLVPGADHRYADLSGPNGSFATLDYDSEPPQLFGGSEVTLDDLGIIPMAKAAGRALKQVAGEHLNCPNCGAALELRAPDRSERVVCPSCRSLLDCTQVALRFLEALKPDVEPLIPIGTVGKLAEGELMVIGFVERCVTEDGVDYFWEEYLLYEKRLGFRWLVRSQNHWNYVTPVAAGDVFGYGPQVRYKGDKFKLFQRGDAAVTYVLGEFYWKVQIGEMVATADFIRPPYLLSREMSAASLGGPGLATVQEGEVNWSLGTYLPPATVAQAFGLAKTPSPRGVAPNQPFLHKNIYMSWGILVLLLMVVLFGVLALSPNRLVKTQYFTLEPSQGPDKPQIITIDNLDLKGRQNIEITVAASVDNASVGVGGDLVNSETGLVQPFDLECERFHGVEDGEAWSEGSDTATTVLSALPEGKYQLHLEVEQFVNPGAHPPSRLMVEVRQGVARWSNFWWALLFVSILPVGVMVYHLMFEMRRWQDSDYSPFKSSE